MSTFNYLYPYNFIVTFSVVLFYFVDRCATVVKVLYYKPDGVSGFFSDIKSFRSHYGPGVDSPSNRNEYQEYFLGLKAAGA